MFSDRFIIFFSLCPICISRDRPKHHPKCSLSNPIPRSTDILYNVISVQKRIVFAKSVIVYKNSFVLDALSTSEGGHNKFKFGLVNTSYCIVIVKIETTLLSFYFQGFEMCNVMYNVYYINHTNLHD